MNQLPSLCRLRLRGLFTSQHEPKRTSTPNWRATSPCTPKTDIRGGLSADEARRQALIRLGGAEQTRQAHRERRTLPWLEDLLHDLRFGLRMMARNPASPRSQCSRWPSASAPAHRIHLDPRGPAAAARAAWPIRAAW
jgi:hypothetical protein